VRLAKKRPVENQYSLSGSCHRSLAIRSMPLVGPPLPPFSPHSIPWDGMERRCIGEIGVGDMGIDVVVFIESLLN